MTEEASAGTQKGRNPARERGEGRRGDEGVCVQLRYGESREVLFLETARC